MAALSVAVEDDGLMVVGTFAGVRERDGYFSLGVRRATGWVINVGFRRHDPQTGEASPVAGEVDGLREGDPIAVAVRGRVVTVRATRESVVMFDALRVHKLDVLERVG